MQHPNPSNTTKSNYEQVLEFTEGSIGKRCPTTPQPMSREEVAFIIKMIQSELCELAQTVTSNAADALDMLHDCIGVDVKTQYVAPTDEIDLIADQYDAFVDLWYYALNCSCKKGVNLSSIFDVVHKANMAKRFTDGTFHRREDGKVIKPDGWREPDVKGEIRRQLGQS
jgi:predicted HAD superfamily Cof-like phosphohydrolase